MTTIGNFAKRVNSDETIDLICMRCFKTAATGTNEVELHAVAQQHDCFPMQQHGELDSRTCSNG